METSAITVLFLCRHNSARSVMAEAFLKALGGDRFQVESAGLEPGALNPLAVKAMQESGIDISSKRPQSVFDLIKAGRLFQYVVTVCSAAENELCPVFPSFNKRLHWDLPDPSGFQGTEQKKLASVRLLRDDIRRRVESWLAELKAGDKART